MDAVLVVCCLGSPSVW